MPMSVSSNDPTLSTQPPRDALTEKLDILASSPALSGLTRQQWARLMNRFEPCRFQKGEIIQEAGEPCEGFYRFDSCSTFLHFDPPIHPEACPSECGEEALAGFARNLFTVVATDDTRGWTLRRDETQLLTKDQPQVKERALTILSNRLHATLEPSNRTPEKPESEKNPLSRFQSIGWITAIAAPWLLYFGLASKGIDTSIAVFTAIMLEVIILWFFTLVDQFIPPFIGIAASIFTGLASPEVALSGFASSSFLELLCVLVISSILLSSGLSFRLLLKLLQIFPKKLGWQLQMPMLLGLLISPVVPSNNSRMALLLPIMEEIASLARLHRYPIAATSVLTSCFSASVIFSNLLPTSKSTTIALFPLLPTETHALFNGLFWLQASVLVTFGMWFAHALFTKLCYRPENSDPVGRELIAEGLTVLGPITFEEWTAGMSIVLLILGTVTYEYHHIPVSSLSGLTLFALLSLGIISKSGFRKSIDWPLVFFLMGSQCLIRIAETIGADRAILESLQPITLWIEGSPWRFITAIIAVLIPIRFMLPGPPSALLVTTLFNPIAIDNHISPWISLFVCGFLSDIWFMPYQSGTWSQTQSSALSKVLIPTRFNFYNLGMNVSRVALAFLSVPYWKWLKIL
jgi:divalent anion:Na+ symporter, DASS family